MRNRSPENSADFIAAGAGTDFQEYVALVVGVLGQQQFLQIELDLFQPGLAFLNLGGSEFLHLRVGQHFLRIAHVLLALQPGTVLRHHRRDVRMLAR